MRSRGHGLQEGLGNNYCNISRLQCKSWTLLLIFWCVFEGRLGAPHVSFLCFRFVSIFLLVLLGFNYSEMAN